MTEICKNLKVVEFASVLAGPAVGMFFAELGAEVIKIENKTTGGDVTRGWKQSAEDPNSPISAYWCSVNWGKTHLFLDLNNPDDQAHARFLTAGWMGRVKRLEHFAAFGFRNPRPGIFNADMQ